MTEINPSFVPLPRPATPTVFPEDGFALPSSATSRSRRYPIFRHATATATFRGYSHLAIVPPPLVAKRTVSLCTPTIDLVCRPGPLFDFGITVAVPEGWLLCIDPVEGYVQGILFRPRVFDAGYHRIKLAFTIKPDTSGFIYASTYVGLMTLHPRSDHVM